MKKEYVYCGIIALGVLAPIIFVLRGGVFNGSAKLDSPEALADKVLHGSSTEERVAAAKGLIQQGPAARKQIHEAFAACPPSDPEVRAYLLQAVMVSKDWRSLPAIFDAMGDPDATVRGRAAAAATELSGLDEGFLANDPPEKREKALAKLRHDYESIKKSRLPKFYSDQEP